MIDFVYYSDLNIQIDSMTNQPILHLNQQPPARYSLTFYGVHVSMELKESNTLQNLKDAFAGESQANRRYLYFAAKADVEGENDVAAVFRSTAAVSYTHLTLPTIRSV